MATSQEFIEAVCFKVSGERDVRYRKMFGEYMVYVNDKPVLLVCDNTVYVKKLKELEKPLEAAEVGIPYPGSKEHYILNMEDAALVEEVIEILERVTPLPKKVKK